MTLRFPVVLAALAGLAACAGAKAMLNGDEDPEDTVADPGPTHYGNTRCSSQFPIGSPGWNNDCTPPFEKLQKLAVGRPYQEVVAELGEPDGESRETCGRRSGPPWDCRLLTYGRCTMLFQADHRFDPLVTWVCRAQ